MTTYKDKIKLYKYPSEILGKGKFYTKTIGGTTFLNLPSTLNKMNELNIKIYEIEQDTIACANYLINNIGLLINDDINDDCMICLDKLNNESYVLNCNHKFHTNCLSKYLKVKNNCPLCNSKILS